MKFTIPLHFIDLHDDGYHALVEVMIFGKLFKLVLDTGASKTALDHAVLLQANAEAAIDASDSLSTGLGTNSMASFTAVIHDMSIGELAIPAFTVAVLDLSAINVAYSQLGHPEVLGVLGSDILMKYKAVIDYGKRELKLKKKAGKKRKK
jgi:hypothetical protein